MVIFFNFILGILLVGLVFSLLSLGYMLTFKDEGSSCEAIVDTALAKVSLQVCLVCLGLSLLISYLVPYFLGPIIGAGALSVAVISVTFGLVFFVPNFVRRWKDFPKKDRVTAAVLMVTFAIFDILGAIYVWHLVANHA